MGWGVLCFSDGVGCLMLGMVSVLGVGGVSYVLGVGCLKF